MCPLTVQNGENSELTIYSRRSGSVGQRASAIAPLLTGLLERKGYGRIPQENTYDFLREVEKYASILRATVYVTFKRANASWILHKNKREFSIIVLSPSTNNNTHTRASETITP